jgi:PAS domain S-box-containing protein
VIFRTFSGRANVTDAYSTSDGREPDPLDPQAGQPHWIVIRKPSRRRLVLEQMSKLKGVEEALQPDERSLSLIIDTIPNFVWSARPDGYRDFLNQRWLDYAGMTAQQAVGWGWTQAIHPDDREGLVEYWRSCLASGSPGESEARMRRFDGAYRWFLIRANPLRDPSGTIIRWYGASVDIEDRKRTEVLRTAEMRTLQMIADGASLQDILDHLCSSIDQLISPWVTSIQLMDAAGTSWSRVMTPLPVWSHPILEKDGQVLGTFTVYSSEARDPTGAERTLVEEAARIALIAIEHQRSLENLGRALDELQKSEAKLRQVIDTIPALAWCNLPDGSNEFLNRAWHDYTGLSPEESQGWGWQVAFHPEDLPALMDKWLKMLASGEPGEIEARLRRHDGAYRWFLIRAEPFHDEAGTVVRWYGTSTDIDDRKRAESEVEQAYLGLAEAQRLSKTGSFITDVLADQHNWSEELYRIFELDPATRISHEAIRAAFHPEDLPIYEAAFKDAVEGRDMEITFRIITPAGNVKHIHGVSHLTMSATGRPVFTGAVQDVTASKMAEEALNRARSELAHMARVTTLSALTASIGHEVNQPITALITSADACLRWLNRDQPDVGRAREAAVRIQEDGKRAAEIISHLKSFYRKDVLPRRELVSANDVVREMLVLLRSEADRHSLVMRTELAAGLPMVRVDRVQLQQVLMNLMLNGMEASTEQGGELTIRTRGEPGAVLVSVSDTGEGIPADRMEQMFNAFFSTKAGGTGMGLAISRTIIESHGGRLWATANPGPGATFHFTLPTDPEA